jgi:methylglutaconyl-CoA hydratase
MVKTELRGEVLWLVLDRPEVGNALDPSLIDGVKTALASAASDDAVRAIVLTGAGKHFSAGADLNYMKSMRGASAAENEADARRTQAVFAAVAESPKPVVARVQGAARGGGVGLLAAADVVVASEAATFVFTEVRLGIIPAIIAPFVVARTGTALARRLFLTGESFSAAQAATFGLVDHVVAPEALDATVEHVTVELRRGGPQALREVKRLLADLAGAAPDQAAGITAARIATLRASEEGQEGMSAFLEKRPPRWIR